MFAADVGVALSVEQIHAVARDIKEKDSNVEPSPKRGKSRCHIPCTRGSCLYWWCYHVCFCLLLARREHGSNDEFVAEIDHTSPVEQAQEQGEALGLLAFSQPLHCFF